jgi:outer membrane protein TolC
MMRWKAATWLAALGMVAFCGCAQYFIREIDYKEFHERNHLPHDLETNPTVEQVNIPGESPTPSNVNFPDLPPRYISLNEAIATALQQGYIGSQSVRFPGVSDDLVQFAGPTGGLGTVGSDSIRVLSLNPALLGSNIDRELSRFDTEFTASMAWNTTDEPAQGLSSLSNGQAATLATTLAKPLATGGVAGITFQTDYRLLSRPPTGTFGVLSPSYTPRVLLGFEQPLLRNAGVEINQVLPAFIQSGLFPGVNGRRPGTGEGILISRIRFDQQRADFERSVNFILLNVESQYWTLYGAYVSFFAADQALNMAYQTWKVGKARYEEGKDDITVFAPTRGLYEQFRGDRLAALGAVLEAERNLRTLLGMPVSDGTRLVPVDAPTLAPYLPDWSAALQDALTLRPEITIARHDVKARQLNMIAQLNFLKPDLRFTSTYQIVGLGKELDANNQYIDSTGTQRSTNALRSLVSDHFNDWSVGLTLNVPLGYRAEAAFVRQARLQLAQSFYVLKEQELKAQNFLAKQYRVLQEQYKTIMARRQSRIAYAEELEGRFRKIAVGKATVDRFLLTAEQEWTTALTQEYQAIVAYNTALAAFEFAKGTIQKYDGVSISEGPLPQCAQVRAVEHEREVTHAVVAHERAVAGRYAEECLHTAPHLPPVPAQEAPTLPALLEATKLVKEQPAGGGLLPAAGGSDGAAAPPPLRGSGAPGPLPAMLPPVADPPRLPAMLPSLPPAATASDAAVRLGIAAPDAETAAGRPAQLGGPLR